MRSLWFSLILLIVVSDATAGSVDDCPILPPNSGLEWTFTEGPDFDVCRASHPGSEDYAFGIYLGNHPSLRSESAVSIENGRVAGRRVTWYRQESGDYSATLARQTLLTLDRKSGYVAHIWVSADSERNLQNTLSILQRIVFKAL